jgi:hypothetical protein
VDIASVKKEGLGISDHYDMLADTFPNILMKAVAQKATVVKPGIAPQLP